MHFDQWLEHEQVNLFYINIFNVIFCEALLVSCMFSNINICYVEIIKYLCLSVHVFQARDISDKPVMASINGPALNNIRGPMVLNLTDRLQLLDNAGWFTTGTWKVSRITVTM